jgi:hypothetical protein
MERDDESKRLANGHTNLPSALASSKLQKLCDERMSLSEAIEAAERIINRYPNGGGNAGDGYIGALTEILRAYPKQTAVHCAEVRGITAQCRFLPTIADMVAWLDDMSKSLYRQTDRERRVEQQMADRERPDKTEESKARVWAMLEEHHQRIGAPPPGPQPIVGVTRRYSYGEFLAMPGHQVPIGRFERTQSAVQRPTETPVSDTAPEK